MTLHDLAQRTRRVARPSPLDDGSNYTRFWRALRTLVECHDVTVSQAAGAFVGVPGRYDDATRRWLLEMAARVACLWFDEVDLIARFGEHEEVTP